MLRAIAWWLVAGVLAMSAVLFSVRAQADAIVGDFIGDEGEYIRLVNVPCTNPQVLQQAKPGEKLYVAYVYVAGRQRQACWGLNAKKRQVVVLRADGDGNRIAVEMSAFKEAPEA